MSEPILLTLPTPSFDALVETLHGAKPMTAQERSAKWSAEFDAIENMSPAELLVEVRQLASRDDFLGSIAKTSLISAIMLHRASKLA